MTSHCNLPLAECENGRCVVDEGEKATEENLLDGTGVVRCFVGGKELLRVMAFRFQIED